MKLKLNNDALLFITAIFINFISNTAINYYRCNFFRPVGIWTIFNCCYLCRIPSWFNQRINPGIYSRICIWLCRRFDAGVFTFIYVVIFLCSFFASVRLATEKIYIIALFSFFCAFLQELMVILFYYSAFKFDVLINMYFVFLPQALIVSLFAPVFFYLMRRVEVFFYGKTV